MPSFDIVSEVNQVEVRNALDQTNKEVSTRFDFKGSDARVEHADKTLTIYADDDFKLKQVTDILTGKLAKRQVDIRSLKPLDEETILASVGKTGRVVIVQEAPRVAGFGAEIAAVIAEKAILDLQGPVLRVTGYDVPFPYWSIEHEYLPTPERVVDAARKVLAY